MTKKGKEITTSGVAGPGVKRWMRRTGTYFRASHKDSAMEIIGPLSPGISMTGVTGGQFSAIDAMEHMVDELGPADVRVTAWATGIYDVGRARQIRERGDLREVRFLVDKAPFEKAPWFAGALIEAFGQNAFRAAAIHSKIIIVTGDRGRAVLRTSMGFNKNVRTENFDLDVNDDIEAFYREWFDALWDLSATKLPNKEIFSRVFERYERLRDAGALGTGIEKEIEEQFEADPAEKKLAKKKQRGSERSGFRMDDVSFSESDLMRMLED